VSCRAAFIVLVLGNEPAAKLTSHFSWAANGTVSLKANKLVDGAAILLAKSVIEFVANRAKEARHRVL
jgi:hypothetical protein